MRGQRILSLRALFATVLAKNLNYKPLIDNATVAEKPQAPILLL